MKNLVIIFIIGSILLQQGYAQHWQKVLEKDGIIVWLPEKMPATGQQFRASTVINAPVGQIIDVIRKARTYSHWVDRVSEAKIVKFINNDQFIIWYRIEMPLGFEDRDIVLKNTVIRNRDVVKIVLTSAADAYPLQPGLKRIKNAYGYWLLRPLSNNRTKVTYEFYSDLGFSLPQSWIKSLIVNSPYTTLKNLRQWVEHR